MRNVHDIGWEQSVSVRTVKMDSGERKEDMMGCWREWAAGDQNEMMLRRLFVV